MAEGKGSCYPSEHSTYRDAESGAVIHQMTRGDAVSHPTYFLQSSFTPGDRSLIFTSYRTGPAQLFEANFPDGEIRQLTAGPPIHAYSPLIDRTGRGVIFVRSGEIWRITLDYLTESRIAAFDGAQLGECSLDVTGEWLAAAYRSGSEHGIATGRVDGREWRLIPFPRTVIHPQFHPLAPEWIEFAADPAPRMHRVRRDGSGCECLYQHGNGEFVVHETFLGATGDLLYTVWPHRLCRFGWTTRAHSVITEFNCWHITPNRAGTLVLCDTNHPDRGLFLVDVETGARRFVCRTESSNRGSQWERSCYALAEDFVRARSTATENLSWMESGGDTVYGPQSTHPHPAFSATERLASFTSDRSGVPQVYVVELVY